MNSKSSQSFGNGRKGLLFIFGFVAILSGCRPCPWNGVFPPWGNSAPDYTHYNDVGSGTPGDPYQLFTAAQLEDLSNQLMVPAALDADYILMNDVDMTGYPLQIGHLPYDFLGTFNGQDHTIENVSMTSSIYGDPGVFNLGPDGTLENLALENILIYLSTTGGVGAIGYDNDGVIFRVRVLSGTLMNTNSSGYVGGLIGRDIGGNISQSWVSNIVVNGAGQGTGGLVGYSNGSEIQNCFSDASVQVNVSMASSDVGGLVGYAASSILDSYSLASVNASSSTNVGGAIGSSAGMVSDIFAGGSVLGGSSNVDPVIGESTGPTTGITYISGDSCSPLASCSATPYISNPASYYYASSNLPTFPISAWDFSGTSFPILF